MQARDTKKTAAVGSSVNRQGGAAAACRARLERAVDTLRHLPAGKATQPVGTRSA